MPKLKRFAYYKSLNQRDQAIYRQSDGVMKIELPPFEQRALLEKLKEALVAGQSRQLNHACKSISNIICDALDVPRISYRIHKQRPSDEHSELHGFYEEIDEKAFITLYSQTAIHRRPVALKTFVRTFVHEICHHLDYHHLKLSDSFHTMGFYSRENLLSKWLIGDEAIAAPDQLSLF